MIRSSDGPPSRPETAGDVDEQEGDVDADLSTDDGPDDVNEERNGGTPDDAAGESGA